MTVECSAAALYHRRAMGEQFNIRSERPGDIAMIRDINERAFGRLSEANLVDRLRANCEQIISLVAESIDGTLIAHALFAPATIECDDGRSIAGAALGPIAVLPEFQRRGAGSALIRAGIEQLETANSPFIVVLGHPEYYPRFRFVPAQSTYGIRSRWSVRDEVFMIRILDAAAMRDVKGIARYRAEFSD
jgi:putative acetyltransferase